MPLFHTMISLVYNMGFVTSFLGGCGQIRWALAREMVYKIGFVGGISMGTVRFIE